MTNSITVGGKANAQSSNASQLVEQGLVLYQSGDITAAIKQWEQALSIYRQNNNSASGAIARENLARAYQQIRQGERAIKHWQEIIPYYRQIGNQQKVGRSLTELAQVYSSLGQTKKALELLCNPDEQGQCSVNSAVQIANSSNDAIGQAAGLGSLGDINRLMGDYKQSRKNLQKSLEIVKKINNPELHISILNSLGNTYISLGKVSDRQAKSATARKDNIEAKKLIKQAKENNAHALKYLYQSLDIARKQQDIHSEMGSLLRIIPLYRNNGELSEAETSLKRAIDLLERLPYSRSRVYAAIDIVDLMHLLQSPTNKPLPSRWSCINRNSVSQEISLLEKAVKVAKQIKDYRAESFALGALGHIYECRQQYSQAIKITNQARFAAEQKLKAQDSLYLWEWQIGRILKAQGKVEGAIFAYEQSRNTLDTIRQDILTANRDIQFDFRDTIEPIYRQLIALRLTLEESVQTRNKSLVSENRIKNNPHNINNILETVSLLKLAELQNYFGNDCLITPFQQKNIQEIGDTKTAFLNTIILSDKTVVVLTLPNGENKLETIKISRDAVKDKIHEFRKSLETVRYAREEYNTKLAQELYNWLVKPFIAEIKSSNIKTLVFVQDGILRSVPMAALHDGEKFLIQQYAVATIPSINLTDIRPLQKKKMRILALGLSKLSQVEGKKFNPLDQVPNELEQILSKIPGKKLIDENFTTSNLEQELNQDSYPIIHIATHGSFGIDSKNTFIITGEKNTETGDNKVLNFNELEKKVRKNARNQKILELLTLTACETAVGDERSTLGLAGVAVEAGAKSAIASLWAIQDDSTAQIATDFYSKLKNPNMSKAEALQVAQKALLEGKEIEGKKYTHPAYWSPLILIGNWR